MLLGWAVAPCCPHWLAASLQHFRQDSIQGLGPSGSEADPPVQRSPCNIAAFIFCTTPEKNMHPHGILLVQEIPLL